MPHRAATHRISMCKKAEKKTAEAVFSRLSKKPVGPRIINYRIKNRFPAMKYIVKSLYIKKQQRKQKNRTTVRFLRFLSFARGQYLGGPPKSHRAFWGEEKCTLEVSNRRNKSFKRRLRTYRRAFRRRLPLAKYKIQLVFLTVYQRVGLYNLLQAHLFDTLKKTALAVFSFYTFKLNSRQKMPFLPVFLQNRHGDKDRRKAHDAAHGHIA